LFCCFSGGATDWIETLVLADEGTPHQANDLHKTKILFVHCHGNLKGQINLLQRKSVYNINITDKIMSKLRLSHIAFF
jgi:hypothetical protein